MSWRLLARLTCAGLLLLADLPALALSIAPPEPLQIRFESGQDRLTSAGEATVDRLAVRSAQCRDGRLRVVLSHRADSPPGEVESRYRAVRQRLAGLGVAPIYVNRTAKRRANGADTVWASVEAAGDEYCFNDDSQLLRQWVGQLAQHAAQPASRPPGFWVRMTPQVRREDLALPLARVAYCHSESGVRPTDCTPRPEVFGWLAERVGTRQPRDMRQRWLAVAWSAVDDEALAHWQQRLRAGELPLALRAWHAGVLVGSDLPWPVVQQRLLAPGLMAEVGTQVRYSSFPTAARIVEATVARHQIDALPRLIAAAGEQATGLYWELIRVAVEVPEDADAERLLALLPAHYEGWPLWNSQLVEVLVLGEHCPGMWGPQAAERYARIWQRLLATGFQPDPQALRTLTERSHSSSTGECLIRALPDQPYRFQRIARN